MLEYKREKATLEAQVKDIRKRSLDHDDHLRIVDAWWAQVRVRKVISMAIVADYTLAA